jgi:hypothetical protein
MLYVYVCVCYVSIQNDTQQCIYIYIYICMCVRMLAYVACMSAPSFICRLHACLHVYVARYALLATPPPPIPVDSYGGMGMVGSALSFRLPSSASLALHAWHCTPGAYRRLRLGRAARAARVCVRRDGVIRNQAPTLLCAHTPSRVCASCGPAHTQPAAPMYNICI